MLTLGVLIVLVAASGFGFLAHLLFDRKVSALNEMQAEFGASKDAVAHIRHLHEQIEEQAKTTNALQRTNEKYHYESTHDPLTRLPNRRKFREVLGLWLKEAKGDPKFSFTVLSLDLNRFKTINESLGHSLGDTLINQVADRLRNSVRQKDLVARFGGDEFGILLHKVSKIDDVTACVEIIVRNLREPFGIDSREIFTSMRVGIAVGNSNYLQAEDIIRDAEIAMDHAKKHEKDFVLFDPKMHQNAVDQLRIETDLRHAIERNEFESYYQPIVSLSDMRLIGFEALMRWNHPERGLVSPAEFIPVAENTNLIIPMTIWMLRETCSQMVKWNSRYPNREDLIISVNLSGKHFAQEDLVRQVKDILKHTGLSPRDLKLELTESAIMDNADTAIFMLKRLRDLGAQLSIDDFGTGYSSLSYLHRFPIDTLKVDRSFVSTMEDGSENGEIVRTVIALAKALNLSVVAEGIETVHQLHQLRILDCEYGQGYLFSPPVTVEKANEMVEDLMRWTNLLPAMPRPETPALKPGMQHPRASQPLNRHPQNIVNSNPPPNIPKAQPTRQNPNHQKPAQTRQPNISSSTQAQRTQPQANGMRPPIKNSPASADRNQKPTQQRMPQRRVPNSQNTGQPIPQNHSQNAAPRQNAPKPKAPAKQKSPNPNLDNSLLDF